jgi:hypothetical protein
MALGQNKLRNKVVLKIPYKTQSITNKYDMFPVTSIAFHSKRRILLLGDEFGNIQTWDVNELIEIIDEYKIKSKVNRGSVIQQM